MTTGAVGDKTFRLKQLYRALADSDHHRHKVDKDTRDLKEKWGRKGQERPKNGKTVHPVNKRESSSVLLDCIAELYKIRRELNELIDDLIQRIDEIEEELTESEKKEVLTPLDL